MAVNTGSMMMMMVRCDGHRKQRQGRHHEDRPMLPENALNSRVLILGGTGAVGGSTAVELSKQCPNLRIVVGGRNRKEGIRMVQTLGDNSEFIHVDVRDVRSLEAAITDIDLIIHAAGPFQHAETKVLEIAIQSKTAYIDVCDSVRYASIAKSYKNKAVMAGVPVITTCGMVPGVSNVMAAALVHAARNEIGHQPTSLRFSYYTAGTGGTGPALLASSFFVFGDKVTTYHQGTSIRLHPYSEMMNIDFGKGIGKKDVFLLNMPEVSSTHEILGVPTVSGRFGSEPWNYGISFVTSFLPTEYLRDRNIVNPLVQVLYPFFRAVDVISGEAFSMRVDLKCTDGSNTSGIISFKSLKEAVGVATASFAIAVLEGNTKPGVWFPEEHEALAVEAREILLKRIAQGATNFMMNR